MFAIKSADMSDKTGYADILWFENSWLAHEKLIICFTFNKHLIGYPIQVTEYRYSVPLLSYALLCNGM